MVPVADTTSGNTTSENTTSGKTTSGRTPSGIDPVATVVAEGAGAFPSDGEPGRTLARIAADLAVPLEVAVSARQGVDRSGVVAALVDGLDPALRRVDLPSVDAPDHPDPNLDRDILVHVVVDRLRDADNRAIAGREPGTTVVVLLQAEPAGLNSADDAIEAVGLGPIAVIPIAEPGRPADAGRLIDAVEACRSAALRRRHHRAIEAIEEAAAAQRFARDRLESFLQRIAVTRAAGSP